ncbi:MAG: type II secretion system protein [Pirellulales bacterium]|nr:type II secretion system protein [Pirellulales bacterium]
MPAHPLPHRTASRGVRSAVFDPEAQTRRELAASPAPGSPSPPGFTFLEVILAAAMLAVLFAITGQLIVNMKRQTRLAERHSLALRTIENSMEELTAMPWDKLDDATIAALELPAAVRDRWPDAALAGSVTASSDPVEAKRISLTLSLSPEARTRPASLTTWIFRRPRE